MLNLQQFTSQGKYLMLALDHRGSFKKLINPENPDVVTDQQAIQLKSDIINAVKDQMSGLLIDKVIGLKAYPEYQKPFLLPVEKSGYTDQAGERVTELEYSVAQLKELSASGAKILLYFNPLVDSAKTQIEIAKKVLVDCQENNLPFFLEIRIYKPDTGDELGNDTAELLLGSLKMMNANSIKPDVWKLEYPGSLVDCQKVSELVGDTPWILLTRGASFEVFTGQLRQAVKAGAVGFLAGRALWQEVCALQEPEKEQFLQETLPVRFKEISDICR